MSKRSEAVKKWRKNSKSRMILAMGGCCANPSCRYDRCEDAMEFHHLDPSKKDFAVSGVRANPTAWPKVVDELRKCILLCANCHREVHAGFLNITDYDQPFDETFADYRQMQNKKPVNPLKKLIAAFDECPVCGGTKPIQNITCSRSCAGHKNRRVDWDNIKLEELIITMSNLAIADKLDVSEMCIRKRMKKLGLTRTKN